MLKSTFRTIILVLEVMVVATTLLGYAVERFVKNIVTQAVEKIRAWTSPERR